MMVLLSDAHVSVIVSAGQPNELTTPVTYTFSAAKSDLLFSSQDDSHRSTELSWRIVSLLTCYSSLDGGAFILT